MINLEYREFVSVLKKTLLEAANNHDELRIEFKVRNKMNDNKQEAIEIGSIHNISRATIFFDDLYRDYKKHSSIEALCDDIISEALNNIPSELFLIEGLGRNKDYIRKECLNCKYRTENAEGYPYCDYFDDWIRDCPICPKW